MGKAMTGGSMSLDGYIAGPNERGFDLLFQRYGLITSMEGFVYRHAS
jgi:hypothetical protein